MFNTTTARIHIGAQATMDGERAFRDGVPYEDAPESELKERGANGLSRFCGAYGVYRRGHNLSGSA